MEKREYYVPSSAQKRLYILQQMKDLSTGYNMIMVVQLEGELDTLHLENVFKALIKRHENFRTSFTIIKENPVQRIHDKVEFEIENFSAGCKTQGVMRQEDRHAPCAMLYAKFIRPFDFALAPLMRVGLIKTAEKTYILLLDMHHVITDGIS